MALKRLSLVEISPRVFLLLLIFISVALESTKLFGAPFWIRSYFYSPRVFIEGGIHGREWLSPAFVTYLINELTNAHRSTNKNLKKIAFAYEWLIVPVLNPDGYEYTHTTDRLWSKNRHFNYGVDLNRNFAIAFGTVDADANIFSDTYGGQAEFSEPETRAMAHFMEKNNNNLTYYLAFHSFGQHFIIPYSFAAVHLENYDEVKFKAVKAMAALNKLYGTEYTVGNALETVVNSEIYLIGAYALLLKPRANYLRPNFVFECVLSGYLMSGASTCWAKKVFQIPYAGSMVLRDGGFFGFALPPEYIRPACSETMEALYSFLDPDIYKTTNVRAKPANVSAVSIRNQGRVISPKIVFIFICFCST